MLAVIAKSGWVARCQIGGGFSGEVVVVVVGLFVGDV